MYCTSGASSSRVIEDAVTACIAMDQEVFRLYEIAVPLMMTSAANQSNLAANQTNPPANLPSRAVPLSNEQWSSLLKYADKEDISLPIFGINTKTNFLLLQMLASDLSRFSAVAVSTVSGIDGKSSALNRQRSHTAGSGANSRNKGARSSMELNEIGSLSCLNKMVISAGNCLYFIEFPDIIPSTATSDSVNLDQRFHDLSTKSTTVCDETNLVMQLNRDKDELFFIDAVDVGVESGDDRSEDFSERLSASSTAHTGDSGNTSPHTDPPTPAVYEEDSEIGSMNGSRSCDISLYCLHLPAFRFVDASIRSLVSQALVIPNTSPSQTAATSNIHSRSTSQRGSYLNLTGSPLDIQEDLRSFILESHMDNFAAVLCSALRKGQTVGSGDIQLGLNRCRQSIVEVDISVMCRKRYIANSSVGGDMLGSSGGSLYSAFENTLGKLLKGLESENVFVLSGESPRTCSTADLHRTSRTVSRSESGEKYVHRGENASTPVSAVSIPAKDKDRGREDGTGSGSRGKISAALSDDASLSSSSVCPPEMVPQTALVTPRIAIADNIDNRLVDKIVLANKESSPRSASPRGIDPIPKDDATVPLQEDKQTNSTDRAASEVNRKGAEDRAIFVRFAVVSRTEKAVTAHSGLPPAQLGSSSSYQSLTSVGSLPCPTPPIGMGGGGYNAPPAASSGTAHYVTRHTV